MKWVRIAVVGFGFAILAGCRDDAPPADAPAAAAAKPAADDHAHKPGQFGGIIVPIGSDSYHAAAVLEAGGPPPPHTPRPAGGKGKEGRGPHAPRPPRAA